MLARILSLLFLTTTLFSCTTNTTTVKQHAFTNNLINETSPYLLQHAHNPVNWEAWNNVSLEKAKREKKLILISVGYAACHWCHVMERETFEDTTVASLMNKYFINIKVDREERPDVDQVYMNAIQLMKGSGGWPLNVIALPDGRPIWAETYLSKKDWINSLEQIQEIYEETPERLVDYATKLEEGIKALDLVKINSDDIDFSAFNTAEVVEKWSSRFDKKWGGTFQPPKFMLPNNYHFLLRFAVENNDAELLEFVNLTLKKMAYGGVYDHVGGGFARYSTDAKWHIPHFEKMLYDNGQLVSLYSDAYLINKDPLYKEVVYGTLEYISQEMTNNDGAFYSSFDADSETIEGGELEEGAYYTYTKKEIDSLLGNDSKLFSEYYNINSFGKWEKEHYVLIRKNSDKEIISDFNITLQELNNKKKLWKKTLLEYRNKRPRPRLDDKTLTSWNAIMLKGYIDAYRVFKDEAFLEKALENAHFLKDIQMQKNGALYHSYKDGKSSINGYLEDYAAVIDAFIALYENTLDEQWLNASNTLANYTFKHFHDSNSKLFYFTSDEDEKLVSRNVEYRDNVIPASNSMMAKNLFKLAHYFDNKEFSQTAQEMLHNIQPEIAAFPSSFSNWLDLMLNVQGNFYEVVIVGSNASEKIKELNNFYIPNKLLAGSTTKSMAPLLEGRYVEGETFIYVCVNNTCKLPVMEVEEALPLLKK